MGDIVRNDDWRREVELTRLEFEARKEYLGRYRSTLRMIDELGAELEEVELDVGAPIGKYGDLPRGGSVSDGSDRILRRMERRDELTQMIEQQRARLLKQRQEIDALIDGLSPSVLGEILYYRYARGMELDEIARRLHYSRRRVIDLHKRALSRIRIKGKQLAPIKRRLAQAHPEWAREQVRIA